MKEVVVISGKGGTGKTTFSASLAPFLGRAVLADCDVDAPNLRILLDPREEAAEDFVGTRKAAADPSLCDGCGLCVERCRFEALSLSGSGGPPAVAAHRCEGCGVCAYVCPRGAMTLEDTVVGTLTRGITDYGPMVGARLIPGEETSGKLVTAVRKEAAAAAAREGIDFVLVDGSPGIGCSVISSLTNAHRAVIVTEPSVSALHDLERLHDLLGRFRIPAVAVVNRCDISDEMTHRIERFCADRGIPVGMKLPFSRDVVEAVSARRIPSLALPEFFREHGFEAFVDDLIGG